MYIYKLDYKCNIGYIFIDRKYKKSLEKILTTWPGSGKINELIVGKVVAK